MKKQIVASNPSISIKARIGRCKPKNSHDHSPFKINCSSQSRIGLVTLTALDRQTNHPATAMATYNTLQTGAKTQLGGVHAGFCSAMYQGPGPNWLPMSAVAATMAKKINNEGMRISNTRIQQAMRPYELEQTSDSF